MLRRFFSASRRFGAKSPNLSRVITDNKTCDINTVPDENTWLYLMSVNHAYSQGSTCFSQPIIYQKHVSESKYDQNQNQNQNQDQEYEDEMSYKLTKTSS